MSHVGDVVTTEEKQALLSEPHVGRRVESLLMILHQNAGQQESKGAFPPPFSVN